MADLDLAKLREQIAREICPEEIDAWNALYASAIADGAYHETAILRADTWHRRGKRSAEKAADRILSLLRPALQAAWEAGRDAAAKVAIEVAKHPFGYSGTAAAYRIAADIRALTPPDYPAALIAQADAGAEESADDLRAAGWSVAVHNDYRLNGEPHTFWLFTHPDGRWIKGEGRTDAEALAACRAALPRPTTLPEATMPADLTTLRALKARVDAATGADMHLDHAIEMAFAGPPPLGKVWSPDPEYAPAYTASIDAAVGLVERLNPGAWFMMETFGYDGERRARAELNDADVMSHTSGEAATLPLAIVSALLNLLIAQAEAGAEESATDIEEHP